MILFGLTQSMKIFDQLVTPLLHDLATYSISHLCSFSVVKQGLK